MAGGPVETIVASPSARPAAPDSAAPSGRLTDLWTGAIAPVLIVRASLMGLGLAVAAAFAPHAASGFLGIWRQWDAPHYLEIAAGWYGPSRDWALSAFFPLLPALIRAGSAVLDPMTAGMLIALLSTLFAAVGLYRLVLLDGGDEARARASVLAMLVFPTAFAFVPPYTEPLFLALVIWSFLRARRRDWLGAGVLGALAAAARLQGILLVPALAVAYLEEYRRPGRGIALTALPAVGTVSYLLVNQIAYGNPLYFLQVQRVVFFHQFAFPWQVMGSLLDGLLGSPLGLQSALVYGAPLVAFALLAAVTVWAFISPHSRPSYAIYSLATLVSLSTMTWPISVPRYILGVFPLYPALAGLSRWPAIGAAAAIGSALLLGLFTTFFVLGRWAF